MLTFYLTSFQKNTTAFASSTNTSNINLDILERARKIFSHLTPRISYRHAREFLTLKLHDDLLLSNAP